MTDHVGNFHGAVELFDDRVRATARERWSSPSPCDGWTAGDVAVHVIRNLRGLVAALRGGDFMDTREDPVDPDVLAAWAGARTAAEAAIGDVDDLGRGLLVAGREATVEYLADGLMRDLVIHAWDLARATGGDERLPPDMVEAATAAMALVSEAMRRPGSYGPVLEVPAGADAQTRLLAMAGRRM